MVTRKKKAPARKKVPVKKVSVKKATQDPFDVLAANFQEQFARDTRRSDTSGGSFGDKVRVTWFSIPKGIKQATLRIVPDMHTGLLFLPVKVHTFRKDGTFRSWIDFDWLLGRNDPNVDKEIIMLKEYLHGEKRLTKAMIDAWNETNDPAQELARTMKKGGADGKDITWSRLRFLWNVYDKADKTVKIYESSKAFKEAVESLMSAVPALAHPIKGRNLLINVSMADGRRVFAAPMLAPRKTSIRLDPEDTINLLAVANSYKYCDFKYKIDRTFDALGDVAEEYNVTADTFFNALQKYEDGATSDEVF